MTARPTARRRARALLRRLRRDPRRGEQAVVQAFVELAEQQREHGRYTKDVERAIAKVLPGVAMTTKERVGRTKSPAVKAVIERFHTLYYDDRRTWRQNTWLGTTTWKCPFDLWLYQEIIADVRPGLIVETGTAFGGSASYLAWLCDALGDGHVVSIDIKPKAVPPAHPRISYLTGSSTDPEIVEKVRAMLPTGQPVMVILDSNHRQKHVFNELQAYADMVTPGSYLIVEDTNINGHPVRLQHGPGPMEALNRFLKTRDDFVIDRSMHRYHLTQNPRGFLRRVA